MRASGVFAVFTAHTGLLALVRACFESLSSASGVFAVFTGGLALVRACFERVSTVVAWALPPILVKTASTPAFALRHPYEE